MSDGTHSIDTERMIVAGFDGQANGPICNERSTVLIRPAWRWGVGAGLAAGAVAVSYRREKRRALRALRAGSQMAPVPGGEIEYAARGQGPAVLIMHGGGGGYEQGLWLADLLALGDCRVIAPSRPGHRRTPLATGRSVAAQARAARDLLDQLGVASAVVVGLSAGGPSALRFAIDHADRCRGLVLLSAQGPALSVFQLARYWLWLLSLLLSSDVLLWVMLKLGLTALGLRMQGHARHDGDVGPLLRSMFPISDLRAGTLNDLENALAQTPLEIEAIRIPTLLLHGTRDASVPYAVATDTARRVPGARLVTIPGGTHFMMVSHQAAVGAAVRYFMSTCQGSAPHGA